MRELLGRIVERLLVAVDELLVCHDWTCISRIVHLPAVEASRHSGGLSVAPAAWLLQGSRLEGHRRAMRVGFGVILTHLVLLLVVRRMPCGTVVAALSCCGAILLLLVHRLLLILAIDCVRGHEHRWLPGAPIVADRVVEILLSLLSYTAAAGRPGLHNELLCIALSQILPKILVRLRSATSR